MPYPSEHAARILDPDKFQQDSFRRKNIAPGIDIIIGKLKGEDKMTVQAYRFDREKFSVDEAKKRLKEHKVDYIDFEPAKSILSSIPVKKGKDIIMAFVKDGTEAFDDHGNKFIITAEALDADWKTWEGGHITANHKVAENGKIVEVWREKPFVYGRITGLSEELLAMILSPAYQGTSQESEPLEISNEGKVMRLKGIGTTMVFYPEVPACPLTAGCGEINIASLIPNFSLNTQIQNYNIKSTGGTKGNMTEYTQDQIKEMLAFMETHSDMVTEDMKTIMQRMMGIDKTEENVSTLKKQVEAKDIEIAGLKSQGAEKEKLISEKEKLLADKTNELKSFQEKLPEMVNATLDARAKYDVAVTELKSIAPADKVTEFLSIKPTMEAIQNMVKMLGSIGGKVQVGAGSGIESTTPKSGATIGGYDPHTGKWS